MVTSDKYELVKGRVRANPFQKVLVLLKLSLGRNFLDDDENFEKKIKVFYVPYW